MVQLMHSLRERIEPPSYKTSLGGIATPIPNNYYNYGATVEEVNINQACTRHIIVLKALIRVFGVTFATYKGTE